ncbi:MAG: sulfatase family protein [Methylococcaceae bacterium]
MTADGLGFRYDLPYKLTSERWVTQQSILFLEDQLKNRSTTPFFLHASYFAPHHPYGPVEEFDTYLSKDMFLAPSWTQEKANNFQSTIRAPYGLPPFTADQYRDLKAYYFGFIAQVDNEVGRLLNWLDTHPAIAENTIVIFLSDHGDMMSEHGLLFKGNMYEGSVGIPFMIRWPGIAPRKESAPVSHIDIMPTILAAAGIPFPDGLSGEDLKPLLATSSPGSEWTNRTVISEYFPPSPFPWGLLMARSERYKLIATRTSTITMDYQYQLYDLVADPWEMSNLAAKPEFSDVLSFLKTELEAHKAKQSKFLPASMPAEVPRCTWDIKFPYDPLVAPWEPVKVLHCP